MKRSEVIDRETNMRTITERGYDGLGRRTLARDAGSTGMRTLYDGRSFEVIRESEVFADGSFTVNWNTGITGSPAGEESDGGRYRWIDDETNSGNLGGRYRSIDEGYGKAEERYTGIKTSLYAKGEAAGVNLTGGRGNSRGGRMYLGTDILGSVRSVSGEYGNEEERYEYDVFGAPYEGEFTQGLTGGYTGKPYDAVTGLYNYGYRDYKPESARFTTVDPIRDGSNWYSYVMNDPVNYADAWGLSASEKKAEPSKELAEVKNGIAFPIGLSLADFGDNILVSSGWGERPPLRTEKGQTKQGHNGVDLPAPAGTRVNAIGDGKVITVGYQEKGYGNYVIMTHASGTKTLYAHQKDVYVKEGDTVTAGQQIGTVGSTGKSTGNHLHFGFDGNKDGFFSYKDPPDNPMRILFGGSE